jgi:hypothetical protein
MQFRGAVSPASTHPTETERARAQARRILDERRTRAKDTAGGLGGDGRKSSRRSGVVLPFVDVNVAGPVKWLWRGSSRWAR